MKFIISRASDYGWREPEKGIPIEGACRDNDSDQWFIHVESLVDLIEMIDQEGCSLIMGKLKPNGGVPHITIYDAFVE